MGTSFVSHETFPASMSLRKTPQGAWQAHAARASAVPSSLIRTFRKRVRRTARRFPTVGSGFGPDLLTFRSENGSARGLVPSTLAGLLHLPPVGNLTPP